MQLLARGRVSALARPTKTGLAENPVLPANFLKGHFDDGGVAASLPMADVARTYNVDATTIGRLLGDRPFPGGANLVALQ
jgi:hypothetical protein